MKDFRVELKVCEACGALWLRAIDHGVYCRGCALRLSDFPETVAESLRIGRNKLAGCAQPQMKAAKPALRLVAFAGGSR
jgi:hypothetical protein